MTVGAILTRMGTRPWDGRGRPEDIGIVRAWMGRQYAEVEWDYKKSVLDNHRAAAFAVLGKECPMVSAEMPVSQGGHVHIPQ